MTPQRQLGSQPITTASAVIDVTASAGVACSQPGVPVTVEASCRKSKIYHAGAAAQRVIAQAALQVLHRSRNADGPDDRAAHPAGGAGRPA